MSDALAANPPADTTRARLGWALAVGVVVLATAAAVVAGGGPIFAILPAALAGAGYALVRAPLRWSVAALLVLMLAVDDTSSLVGQWRTPFAVLGDLVHNQLDDTLGVPRLAVTGMEVIVAVLLAVWAHRRAGGDRIDMRSRVPTARALRGFVALYVLAVLFAVVNGVLQGQGMVPWKVRNLLHPILLFVLFDAAFRGPADHALLGRVVVFAAVCRAVLAIVVQRISIAETGGKFAYATSHGDSILLAVGTFVVVVDLLVRANGARLLRAACLLPILAAGMIENQRRLVWVMLTMMGAVTYLVAPMRGWKRTLTRAALVVLPLLALYAAVGWNRQSRIFAPVQTLRSIVDTSYDHSAYWREVENWNIAVSIRERPILGIGLGGWYTEHMANDDISGDYQEYRQWPHNTVLGLMLLLGALGFASLWALFTVGLYLAFRSYRMAATADQRVASLACVGAIVACHVLAYGDTGAHYPQYKVFVALALAVAGKLAAATGAWPARSAGGAASG